MAGRHFLARGFRNFGYLGIDPDRTSQLQFSGLREVLDAAGMECDACWVERLHPEDKSSWQRFEKNLGQWIDGLAPPIAVFATTDLLARYIAESARERGLRMPGDVALTGAGNEVAICTTPEPSLSSIDYDFMRIGRRAAEVLDHLMDGKPAGREPIHLPPSQLVVRTSSGAFAVDQPIVTEALSYIGENLGQPLGVDHIAERVATTPRTLTRLFRKSLGKSVYQTITQLRLERVKRDLLESDDLLKAIAPRCGFRDAIHLCKVFQREEGITPSEYRTLRKQGKQ